ncbi:MAG: hypothetical protein IJA97_00520 [Clostridia bacterium]|nr:hypothetical protein [Clostridia bacterium]
MNVFPLLQQTNAYKIFNGDKLNGTLSHAYLIACDDEFVLDDYLSAFARALTCESESPCGECRTCKLVTAKTHTDVIWYPKGTAKKIVVSDIDELVEKSYFKPLELGVKVFCLSNVSQMTVQAQNKLLKTLEEPPENTFILMSATSVYPLLSTVLSRVKRLDLSPYSDGAIEAFLVQNGYETSRVKEAVSLSNGRLGEAIKRYEANDGSIAINLAKSVLTELKSSKQVAEFSAKITKDILRDFVSALSKLLEVSIRASAGGKESDGFDGAVSDILRSMSVASLIFVSDKVREAEKALYFNGNHQAVVDGLLFGILEGKFKWSK